MDSVRCMATWSLGDGGVGELEVDDIMVSTKAYEELEIDELEW